MSLKPGHPDYRSTSIDVIIAARRRGWTLEQIGNAAGVTRERIRQRVAEYEKKHGVVLPRYQRFSRHRTLTAWKCTQCGKSGFSRPALARGKRYCSADCLAAARVLITDEMVESAIDLRRVHRETWTLIGKQLGHPIQAIQVRIWKYLHSYGALNRATVDAIWCIPEAEHTNAPAYGWLEKNTGLAPTEGGTVIVPRYAGASRTKPWRPIYDRRQTYHDDESAP